MHCLHCQFMRLERPPVWQLEISQQSYSFVARCLHTKTRAPCRQRASGANTFIRIQSQTASHAYTEKKMWPYFGALLVLTIRVTDAYQFSTVPGDSLSHWWLFPDSKVHGANMAPTWVLSAPGGHHVGPMNFAIRAVMLPFNTNASMLTRWRHLKWLTRSHKISRHISRVPDSRWHLGKCYMGVTISETMANFVASWVTIMVWDGLRPL